MAAIGRKRDIAQFRAACAAAGLTAAQRVRFSDHLHREKALGEAGAGNDGNFTYQELVTLACQWLAEQEGAER